MMEWIIVLIKHNQFGKETKRKNRNYRFRTFDREIFKFDHSITFSKNTLNFYAKPEWNETVLQKQASSLAILVRIRIYTSATFSKHIEIFNSTFLCTIENSISPYNGAICIFLPHLL